jgi:hypothetical protein
MGVEFSGAVGRWGLLRTGMSALRPDGSGFFTFIWLHLPSFGYIWLHLVTFGFITEPPFFFLVWFGLVWSGLVWFGLDWSG